MIIVIVNRHDQQTVIEEGVAVAARIGRRRVGVLRAYVEKRAPRVCVLHHVSQLKGGHIWVGRGEEGHEIEDLAVAN